MIHLQILNFCSLEKARSTILLAFFPLPMAKKGRTYDTFANFKFLTAFILLQRSPEHDTVGIFATCSAKKRPDL